MIKPVDNIKIDDIPTNVTRGAAVCKTLKEHYYPDKAWPLVYRQVADMFTVVKQNMRLIPGYTTEDAMLEQLMQYSQEDLADVYELKDDTNAKPTLEAT